MNQPRQLEQSPMPKPIFRQVALERLSSPEQLDQLMQVTTPKGWLALCALGLLIIAAGIWGIFGSIPIRVQGQGILIRTGGVERILSSGTGQIQEIEVDAGDIIKEGQIVARISQPELVSQIQQAKDALNELLTLKEIYQATNPKELLSVNQSINEKQRDIKLLEQKLSAIAVVKSPYTGRVFEVMADVGDFVVQQGEPILSMELIDTELSAEDMSMSPPLEAVIYVSSLDGKKVRPGMAVQITPSTVKREEYGSLLATVTAVADFPSTQKGMMRVLENENLVQQLSAGIAPIEMRATLNTNPETFSGYQWSSSRGPNVQIYSGTLVTATITVSQQCPISLVLPWFKRKLGV